MTRSNNVRLSVSTGSLYFYPLRWTFAKVKQAGFEGVELAVNWEVACRGSSYVRELIDRFQLPVNTIHPPLLPVPGWDHDEATLLRLIDLAETVGASAVVWHTPRTEELRTKVGEDFLHALESARRRLGGSPVQITLENPAIYTAQGWEYALARNEALRRFADTHELDLTFDTVHAGGSGQGVLESYETFNGRIANIHLSDLRRLPRSLPFSRLRMHLEHHQMPGTGLLPLTHFLRCLKRDGYQGLVTLEVNPLAAGIWWPPAATRRLRAGHEFMQRALDGASIWEPIQRPRRSEIGIAVGE